MAKYYIGPNGFTHIWNKILKLIKGKQDILTFDTTPTANSSNPVTSGGVKTALDEKAPLIGTTADITPTQVKTAIEEGRSVYISHSHSMFGLIYANQIIYSNKTNNVIMSTNVRLGDEWYTTCIFGSTSSNTWVDTTTTIPTKTSDLTNDSNFVTTDSLHSHSNKAELDKIASGDKAKWDYNMTYLNTHPENGPAVIPFIYNDLAFLTKRGGSCKVYSTTSTDFKVAALNEGTLAVSNPENLFDGSPSYMMIATTGDFTAVFDLTLHKTFTYSNKFYIDFGASGWRAKNIEVYVMNSNTETAYTKKANVSDNTRGNWVTDVSHSSKDTSGNTIQGFNKLRIVLSGFNNTDSTSGKRIAQIGLINYGSYGVTETFISRGGCTGIFGSLIPNSTNAIDLGASSKVWRNIYAQNLYKGGKAVATEDFVTGKGYITSSSLKNAVVSTTAPTTNDTTVITLVTG